MASQYVTHQKIDILVLNQIYDQHYSVHVNSSIKQYILCLTVQLNVPGLGPEHKHLSNRDTNPVVAPLNV